MTRALVVHREVTASGAEVLPVLRGDGGVGSDAHRHRGILADLLLDSRVGVDDDEGTLDGATTTPEFDRLLADADFDPRGNPVVVDDVVHACILADEAGESSRFRDKA